MPDLLDLAGPQGLPSFADLASATRPQMMPQAPSMAAGLMYGQDDMKHQDALRQMAGLAQLQAKMQAQKADEFTSAGPGRMDEISAKNALAKDDLAGIDTTVKTRGLARENKYGEEEIKQARNDLKKLEPLLNAYDKAPDPESKAAIHEMAKSMGAKFGKLDLGGMDPKQFDIHMRSLRNAQINDEKYAIEEGKQVGATERKTIEMKGRKDIQEMRGDAMLAAKALGITSQIQLKSAVEQIKLKYMHNVPLNAHEQTLLQQDALTKLYGAEVRAAAIKPTIGISGGAITSTPPNLPARPSFDFTDEAPAAPAAAAEAPVDQTIADRAKNEKWPTGDQGYNPKKYSYRIGADGKLQRKLK